METGYMSEDSDQEIRGDKMRKMYRFATRQSTAQLERLVASRLQPVLKGLEDLQLGIQKLSSKDKEERTKEAASDADDEDDNVIKKPSLLGVDRIKSAVIEALRQEKELFTPPLIDRSAGDKELQNLKSIIDSLKSKLLDSEDNLDREEQAERNAQQVSLFEGAKYDGVFAMWYGKGPGVDRAGDAMKHANAAGSAKYVWRQDSVTPLSPHPNDPGLRES
jgi:hypothetical protein